MKFINKLVVAGVALLATTACVDKDPDQHIFPNPDVDFTYNVDGDEYTLDFYVVSTVQFNNTSAKSGNFVWDFGDGTTSSEVNPTHKFEKAGIYDVTLTLDGVGKKTYPLMIFDIVPVLSIDTQSTDVVEFDNTELTFALELPNPENLRVKYEWTFPEGTVDAAGNPVTSFIGYANADGSVDYPEPVKFKNIGSQRVDIKAWFDVDGENRQLDPAYLNVQVGCSEPAPTLYYAQRGGNIKALKIIDNVPAGTKVLPFDLGVPAGSTVFNLVYADVPETNDEGETTNAGWIYILDAGKQYYYINDEDGVLGDGKVTAMRPDGSGVNTVITNVGGAAFNDPFRGMAYNGNLYYSDRNTGFSSVPLTARGEVEGKNSDNNRASYVMVNNLVPYYGRGISYGAITNGICRDKAGYWWVGKSFNGIGIFRFKDSDIYPTQKDAEKAQLPAPIVLENVRLSTFAIDEAHNRLFGWRVVPNPGFFECPLPAIGATVTDKDITKYIAMDADPINSTDSEGVYTTQFAVDSESGKVYFCYRPAGADATGVHAGIVVYDPATQKISNYGETSDLGTGIVLNPNKTKLF